jgi:hypothetical protein
MHVSGIQNSPSWRSLYNSMQAAQWQVRVLMSALFVNTSAPPQQWIANRQQGMHDPGGGGGVGRVKHTSSHRCHSLLRWAARGVYRSISLKAPCPAVADAAAAPSVANALDKDNRRGSCNGPLLLLLRLPALGAPPCPAALL